MARPLLYPWAMPPAEHGAATDHDRTPVGLAALMDDYLDGDGRAFAAMHAVVGPRVRRHVYRKLGDPIAVDDVVQATFMKAHQSRASFHRRDGNADRAVLNWYLAIARNSTIDYLRRRGRQRSRHVGVDNEDVLALAPWELRNDPPSQEEALLEHEARSERVARVRRAIESLPPQQRQIVELHKLRGIPMAEIARQLDVRAPTLRVRAHRAYRLLAERLQAVAAVPAEAA